MINFIKSTIRVIKGSIFGIILVLLVTFMINNRNNVILNLFPLPFEIETKLFFLIFAAFLIGVVFGILSCSHNIISHLFASLRNRIRIKILERKITKIRPKKADQ